jgi:hypothetical protein
VQYNNAFAQLTQARGLKAMQSARLFAMGNLVGADALIAWFDAKYHYLFWRPQFAIRRTIATQTRTRRAARFLRLPR